MPYIVAVHDISDPDRFWSAADASQFPEGIALHSSYPSGDGTRATCLWEADSVDAVRELVESATGDASANEFFEVNTGHPGVVGLPGARATA